MAALCRTCSSPLEFRRMLCRICGEWSPNDETGAAGSSGPVDEKRTTTLDEVEAVALKRIKLGNLLDDIWGGGFVPGSITLVGGGAGMGKTTVLLQMSSIFAKLSGRRAYFLSAEQSPGEIRLTAERLELGNIDRFRVMREFGAGASIDGGLLKKDPPSCIVVDSVSALCGKDAHAAVMVSRSTKKIAVEHNVPAFLICHMNKQGDFAGLYTLQHDVDTLVTVFGEDNERKLEAMEKKGQAAEVIEGLRLVTAWKNRYGPTGKDYHFMMTPLGLAPVPEIAEKPKRKKSVKTSKTAESRFGDA